MKGFRRLCLILVAAALLPACGVGGVGTLTPTSAPSAPSGLTARSGNGRVALSWNASAAGNTYSVKRSPFPGGPYVAVPAGQNLAATSFVDDNLSNGTRFHYVVSAVNPFGESADSAETPGTPGFMGAFVAAGTLHNLALLEDGTLWSWGSNSWGELGVNTSRSFSNVALPVALDEVTGIAGGYGVSLALRSDGTVWAWGSNGSGELGNGTNTPSNIPVQVPGLTNAVALAAGFGHVLALLRDGTVQAWGRGDFGQLGNGAGPNSNVPLPVPGVSDVVAIAAGANHSLALRSDGTVWAWGYNGFGQLGRIDLSSLPGPVANLTDVQSIAAGESHSLAVRSDGSIWAWGSGQNGELGTGSPVGNVWIPVQVSGLTSAKAVAAGQNFSLAIRSDGTVWAWGWNTQGQIGSPTLNTIHPSPVQIAGLAGIRRISCGRVFCLALQSNGTILAWGDNTNGELGSGTGAVHDVPVPVSNLNSVTALSVGPVHNLALRSDTSAWSWGVNLKGQLGIGTNADSFFRVQVDTTAFPAPTA